MFCKKGVLKNFPKFTGKPLPVPRVSFSFRACNFIKKETLTQVFSGKFYETCKNSFFIKHIWWILLCIRLHPKSISLQCRNSQERN